MNVKSDVLASVDRLITQLNNEDAPEHRNVRDILENIQWRGRTDPIEWLDGAVSNETILTCIAQQNDGTVLYGEYYLTKVNSAYRLFDAHGVSPIGTLPIRHVIACSRDYLVLNEPGFAFVIYYKG